MFSLWKSATQSRTLKESFQSSSTSPLQEFYTNTYLPTLRYLPESVLSETVSNSLTIQQIATKASESLTQSSATLDTLAGTATRMLIHKLLESYSSTVDKWRPRGLTIQVPSSMTSDLELVGNSETALATLISKRGEYLALWRSLIPEIQELVRNRYNSVASGISVASTKIKLTIKPVVMTLSVGQTCIGFQKGATQMGMAYKTDGSAQETEVLSVGNVGNQGQYSVQLTNLVVGTTYKIRAFARNAKGTVYGTEIQYTHGTVPSVTTGEVTRQPGKVFGNGTVTSVNGAPLIAAGVVWSTTANPTVDSTTRSLELVSTGNIQSELLGLQGSTRYFVRAYATNKFGTAYGSDIAFDAPTPPSVVLDATTAGTAATSTSVTLTGSLSAKGTSNITEMGFYWSSSDLGTATPPTGGTKVTVSPLTDPGSFSATLTGLTRVFDRTPNIFVRAFAISEDGTSYSPQISVNYNRAVIPTLTASATSPTARGATLTGTITANQTPRIQQAGFLVSRLAISVASGVLELPSGGDLRTYTFATEPPPNSYTITVNDLPGSYSSVVADRTYNYVGYVKNSDGIFGFTPSASFTITQSPLPTVILNAATSITFTSATLNGSFTLPDGAVLSDISAVGFFYSTGSLGTPTINSPPSGSGIQSIQVSVPTSGTGTIPFSANLTGLPKVTTDTIYNVISYIQTKDGSYIYGLSLFSFRFSNGGVDNWNGNDLVRFRTEYASQSWATDTNRFNVINGIQFWRVPTTGIYTLVAAGGGGGSSRGSGIGGNGVIIRGNITLIAGEILRIVVGTRGGMSGLTGGGGGSTSVAKVASMTQTAVSGNPLLMAGGGGGGGTSGIGKDAVYTNSGSVGGIGGNNGGMGGAGWTSAGQGQATGTRNNNWDSAIRNEAQNSAKAAGGSPTGADNAHNLSNNMGPAGGFGGGGTGGDSGGGGGGAGYSGGGSNGGGGGSFFDPSLTNQTNVGYNPRDTNGYLNISMDGVFTQPKVIPPTVSTDSATNLTTTSATLNGTITNQGSSAIKERGFIWSSSALTVPTGNTVSSLPTASSSINRVMSGSDTSFSSVISGLPSDPQNVDYYYYAYAINDDDMIGYGAVKLTKRLYEFISHTFTNCGATGINGPTLTQCINAYSSASWITNNLLFNIVTQGIQLWTVPRSGIYRIRVMGASGGSNTFTGGRGVILEADFHLTINQILKILVGQGGASNKDNCDTGGGGGTFVTLNNNDILLIAGGGSGSHFNSLRQAKNGVTTQNGSQGMGGAGGINGLGGSADRGGASGAGFSGNGNVNHYESFGGVNKGVAQSFLNGGQGGSSILKWSNNITGGFGGGAPSHGQCSSISGGAGGGYSGGGSGNSSGPGGGGGSFVATNATNLKTSDGKYNNLTTFNTEPITNLGVYNSTASSGEGIFGPAGSVTITFIR